MTIASAFNEITVAQGGTASKSGSIAGAIDKLNDVLAGSDQEAASTIEQAVRLLGQHIGGGSSVTVEALTATENKTYTAPSGKAYSPVTVNVSGGIDVGNLVKLVESSGTLEVDDTVWLNMLYGLRIEVGDTVIYDCGPDATMSFFPEIASGANVSANGGAFVDDPDWDFDVIFHAGTVTGSDPATIVTIRTLDIETTPFEYEVSETTYYGFSFTIPELEDGEILFVNYTVPD